MGWYDQSNENQTFNETKSKEALQDILVSLEDSGADGVKLTAGTEPSAQF
jgi:hypothetical protein